MLSWRFLSCIALTWIHQSVRAFTTLPFPKANSAEVLTVDIFDTVSLPLIKLFRVKPNLESEKLRWRITGPSPDFLTLAASVTPSIKISKATMSRRTVTPIETDLFVQMTQFENVPLQKFTEFCLFMWETVQDDESVSLSSARCLNVNLRVVNNSLDFTKLAEMLDKRVLTMTAVANSPPIKFSTLSRGMLPTYLDYALENCTTDNKDDDINSKPPRIWSGDDKESRNNSAISSREIDVAWSYFT